MRPPEGEEPEVPRITDAFDSFSAWWAEARALDAEQRLASWQAFNAERWSELLRLQVEAYREDGLDWRDVARERVFPHLDGRLADMAAARAHLRRVIAPVCRDAQARLGIDFDVTFVLHVGIGVGAGWATRYAGGPACLLGLENIAELGWHDEGTLAALCAHELGHLAHERWRSERSLGAGRGPLWHL